MKKGGRISKQQEPATVEIHSFHIQLSAEDLRHLRIMAAERGTSAGKLARDFLIKAMEEEARAGGRR